MRLIDADRLKENFKLGRWYQSDTILDEIEDAETIEAEPVRHGHWIVDTKFGNDIMSGSTIVICSECGHGTMSGQSQYCPNCGAKNGRWMSQDSARMDGDGDGE